MRGRRPLRTPFFSPCLPRRGFAGAGAPAPTCGEGRSPSGSKSSDLAPRSALHPGEFFAGRQPQHPTMRGAPPLHSPERALRPAPRPTFSRRESRQRYARNLLVPGPPAKGASPPLIPRPCALAVLVEGVQGLRHPRGARQVDRLGSSSHYRQSIPHNSVQRRLKLLSLLLYII